MTADRTAGSRITAVECGRAFAPPVRGALTLTGHFPAAVSSAGQAVSGTVELYSEDDVHGVVSPTADAFLVRDGHVTTLPQPQDLVGMPVALGPGQVVKLPGEAALAPCDPTVASLATGRYELYARVVLNRDDGTSLEVIGGPWPLEVT